MGNLLGKTAWSKTPALFLAFLLLLSADLPGWADPHALSVSKTELKDTGTELKDQFIEVHGVTLHYVMGGQGQPIVLLHGNEGSLQDFTFSIFKPLARKYCAIAFDRPGHGKSRMSAKIEPIPEIQAIVLHSALYKLGIKKPVIVAHSWSGSVALSYALLYPNDLAALVLLAAMAYDTGEKPKLIYYAAQLPIIGTALAYYYKLTGRKDVKRQLEAAFLPNSTPKEYEDSFLSTLFRTSELKAAARDEITINRCFKRISSFYSRIKVPVMIVAGDHDQTVPPEKNSYPLHKAIAQSELFIIPNAGHELQFTQSTKVLEIIDLAVKKYITSSTD